MAQAVLDRGDGGVEISGLPAGHGRVEGDLHAFAAQCPLHRAIVGSCVDLGMEELPAGPADQRFHREHAGTDVVSVLDPSVAVVDGHAVADGVEYRLEFAGLRAQTEVGGLQFLDLLLHLGIEADLGAVQTEQPVKAHFVESGAQYLLHQ